MAGIDYKGGLTISFQVKDRKKSIAWYEKNLGFKLLYDAAEIGWCEMQTGDASTRVGFSEVEAPKTGGGGVPTFGVADIDTARQSLEKNDVRFDGDTMTIPNLVKLATFFDPDGHALMFFQDLQQG